MSELTAESEKVLLCVDYHILSYEGDGCAWIDDLDAPCDCGLADALARIEAAAAERQAADCKDAIAEEARRVSAERDVFWLDWLDINGDRTTWLKARDFLANNPELHHDDGPEVSARNLRRGYGAVWAEFERWEHTAMLAGSGMTRDQMTGASMMLSWLLSNPDVPSVAGERE